MGTQLPLPKGAQRPLPIFGPYLLWPNGWMDHDATWYGGRPRPRRHCVKWGPMQFSLRKGAQLQTTPFDPCLLWPNGRTRPSQQLLSFCFTLTSHAQAKSALAKAPFTLRTKTRVSVSVCFRYDRYAGVRCNGTHLQQ